MQQILKLGNYASTIYIDQTDYREKTHKLPTESKPETEEEPEEEPKKEKRLFTGFMSQRTKSKIKNIVENWDNAINQELKRIRKAKSYKWQYITFVTLTLPAKQTHGDKEIKKECLNYFLIDLDRLGVKNYLWVAEAQKNGAIHFHILVDRPIHHTKVRHLWNKAVNRLGYVDRFHAKHGHRNPNSTDIHALRDIKQLGSYISKYISKDENSRPIDGRLWSCSQRLGELKNYEIELTEDIEYIIDEAEDQGIIEIVKEEFFVLIKGDLKNYLTYRSKWYRREITTHQQQNFDYLYRDKPQKVQSEHEKLIEFVDTL